jgi:hypothetical protein
VNERDRERVIQPTIKTGNDMAKADVLGKGKEERKAFPAIL